MPFRFDYGFASGKPVSMEILSVWKRWTGSDGLLRDITTIRWTFADGSVRVCRTYQSYRRCKTGGQEFFPMPGRWSWTGERFTEPEADVPA